MRISKRVAAVAAVVGWAGLAVQLILFVDRAGLALGVSRFLGFFTIVSNIGAAAIATAVAFGRGNGLTSAKARLAALTSLLAVALVYSVLLRSLWDPQGWSKLTNIILHDVTPVLFAMLWVAMTHGALRWRDLAWAVAPAALFLAYALGRGAIDGWYPYGFIDAGELGPVELAWKAAVAMGVFALVGASIIAIDMRLARRRGG